LNGKSGKESEIVKVIEGNEGSEAISKLEISSVEQIRLHANSIEGNEGSEPFQLMIKLVFFFFFQTNLSLGP